MNRLIVVLSMLMLSSDASAQVMKPRVIRTLQPARIVITPESDQLLRPELMHVDDTGIDVFDYGDGSLKRFSLAAGKLLGKTGRFGGGPGEFANPTAMTVTPNDALWLYDTDAKRMSIFGSDRKMQREFSPPVPFERFVLYGTGFIGFALHDGAFASVFDNAGRRTAEITAPAWVADMDRLARGMMSDGGNDELAVGFGYTGRILVLAKGTRQLVELPVVESRLALKDTLLAGGAVRKRNTRSVRTVRSIAYSRGLVYALSGGTGDTQGRYVDVYDITSRTYRNSYLLPRAARAISVNAMGIATLEEIDDAPAISFHAFSR